MKLKITISGEYVRRRKEDRGGGIGGHSIWVEFEDPPETFPEKRTLSIDAQEIGDVARAAEDFLVSNGLNFPAAERAKECEALAKQAKEFHEDALQRLEQARNATSTVQDEALEQLRDLKDACECMTELAAVLAARGIRWPKGIRPRVTALVNSYGRTT